MRNKNIEIISIIVKAIIIFIFFFLFWSIDRDWKKIVLFFIYLTINFLVIFLPLKLKSNLLIKGLKILFLATDILWTIYLLIFLIYWIKLIPNSNEESFPIIFSFFCGIFLIVFLLINWLNYLILRAKKNK